MKLITILDWPDVPPSLNRNGRSHPMVQYRIKRRLENDFGVLMMEAQLPRRLELVEARAKLRFPVRRKRDEGNFRWLLEKALGDALMATGRLEDDTPDHYRFFAVQFDEEIGPKRTIIVLTY